MLSEFNLSNILHLTILIIGCFLLLRKVAEIDGYHGLRVFVLTTIFSSPLIFLGILYVYCLLNPPLFICGDGVPYY